MIRSGLINPIQVYSLSHHHPSFHSSPFLPILNNHTNELPNEEGSFLQAEDHRDLPEVDDILDLIRDPPGGEHPGRN